MSWRSTGIGLLISAVSLFLAARQVRFADTAAAFLAASPGPLLAGMALLFLAVAVRCWRWQLLFRPADHVSFGGTFSATFIGYFVNSVLPGRLGEFVRAYLISETDGVSKGRALGTIFVEKLLDILVLLLFLGIVALQVPLPEWATRSAAAVAVAFVVATLGFFGLARFRGSLVAWARAHIDPLPGLRRLQPSHLLDTGLGAADAVAKPVPLLSQLVISIGLWAIAVAITYAVMLSFRLPVPLTAAVLVLVVTNLGMTIPSAPAYVGVYHFLSTETLSLFDVDRSTAFSYSVVMHSVSFGIFILGGLFFMWRRNYVFADLWQRSGSPKVAAEAPPQAT